MHCFSYLVIVNKNGAISDVKHKFFKMIKKEDNGINQNDIVFAEVQNSASIKILVSIETSHLALFPNCFASYRQRQESNKCLFPSTEAGDTIFCVNL